MKSFSLAVLAVLALGAPAHAADGLPAAIDQQVRTKLAGLLKDAGSAQITVTKGPWAGEITVFGHQQKGRFYCAMVNAKNGYGAYVGFRPYMFVVQEGGQVGVWQRGTTPETDAVMASMCPSDLAI